MTDENIGHVTKEMIYDAGKVIPSILYAHASMEVQKEVDEELKVPDPSTEVATAALMNAEIKKEE